MFPKVAIVGVRSSSLWGSEDLRWYNDVQDLVRRNYAKEAVVLRLIQDKPAANHDDFCKVLQTFPTLHYNSMPRVLTPNRSLGVSMKEIIAYTDTDVAQAVHNCLTICSKNLDLGYEIAAVQAQPQVDQEFVRKAQEYIEINTQNLQQYIEPVLAKPGIIPIIQYFVRRMVNYIPNI